MSTGELNRFEWWTSSIGFRRGNSFAVSSSRCLRLLPTPVSRQLRTCSSLLSVRVFVRADDDFNFHFNISIRRTSTKRRTANEKSLSNAANRLRIRCFSQSSNVFACLSLRWTNVEQFVPRLNLATERLLLLMMMKVNIFLFVPIK